MQKGAEYREVLTSENVADLLGVAKFRDSQVHETSEIGLVTGLAWTEVGSTLLQTEVQVLGLCSRASSPPPASLAR